MIKDAPEGQTQYCQSCQELAAQVELMRETLRAIARDNRPYTMAQNAIEVLALPNTSADILRQRDARVIRQFAAVLLQSKPPLVLPFAERYANELERKNG